MADKAIFAGSFDPPTLGHVDIIRRSCKVTEHLIVAVGANPAKTVPFFSLEERLFVLEEITRDLDFVSVTTFQGLVVDFAASQGVDLLLRGVRAFSDFEYEFRMALANRQLSGIETAFLMADARFAHISSTLIRDIAGFGGALDQFLPDAVLKAIVNR